MMNFRDFLNEMFGGKVNLESVLAGVSALKSITPDRKIVGSDSVSGDDYFRNFISVGTVYKNPSGKFKVITDAIFYPAHTLDNGTKYNDEIRFISYEFDPDTLELTGKRNNVGYDFLKNKCEIVATNLCDYIMAVKAQKNMHKVVLELDENIDDKDNDDIY